MVVTWKQIQERIENGEKQEDINPVLVERGEEALPPSPPKAVHKMFNLAKFDAEYAPG